LHYIVGAAASEAKPVDVQPKPENNDEGTEEDAADGRHTCIDLGRGI